ncbi:MAG: AAA family ATPase, partial [Chlorobaculum sp.]|nr:AAA family ATPase [Chlorobaculum sp.]
GRFDLLYEVPPPDLPARVKIFEIHTRTMSLDQDVSIGALAESTAGMSGAEIEFICRKARMCAISECIAKESVGIDPMTVEFMVNGGHFEEAIRLISSR